MKNPTNCLLWNKLELISSKANTNLFELVKTFTDSSHFLRNLQKCKECGQLYFYEFLEFVDWEDGEDPQYLNYPRGIR